MSDNHQDVRLLLGAYVLGALDQPEVLQVEEHLSGCPACRDEVADLSRLPEVLRRRPPTDPATLRPTVPTELLPALLHQVADRRRRERNRWALRTAVAASVAALAVGGVALLTRGPSPTGQRIALSATVGSAAGQAQLSAKPWGSAITVDLSGLPSRGPFVLQTTARDGHREQAATWAGTASGVATVVGATSVTPADVTGIAVLGPDGQELARTSPPTG